MTQMLTLHFERSYNFIFLYCCKLAVAMRTGAELGSKDGRYCCFDRVKNVEN